MYQPGRAFAPSGVTCIERDCHRPRVGLGWCGPHLWAWALRRRDRHDLAA